MRDVARAFSLPVAERQGYLGEDAPSGPDIALNVWVTKSQEVDDRQGM